MSTLLHGPALHVRFAPFLACGALESVDAHVVDTLAAVVGEADPDVLLALALAVHAPRLGPTCVSPLTVRTEDVLSKAEPEQQELAWPADRGAWLAAIARSPLVGVPTDAAAPFVLDGDRLYTARYHRFEARLAAGLRVRLTDTRPPHDAALLQRGLAALFRPTGDLDRQALGAAMACLRGFAVLTGGPGTGKTHTVRAVLTLLWAQAFAAQPDRPLRIALAAPTGKAAARMREALLHGLDDFLTSTTGALPPGATVQALQASLAELRPRTLHRLLGWRPATPTRFRHHRADPLPYDLIVVDEASMIDLAMMARLEDAVAPSARLVLLGDPNQLASVEAGTVLADLCRPVEADVVRLSAPFAQELARFAGVQVQGHAELLPERSPFDGVVRFTRSRRFGEHSGIGALARACLAGDAAHARRVLHSQAFPDAVHLDHTGGKRLSAQASALIADGYAPVLAGLLAGPPVGQDLAEHHADALRAFDGFRLLAAHRRGPLGVDSLNQAVIGMLQRRFHRLDPRAAHWVGRPILVTKNDPATGLFNGDIGLTVWGQDGALTIAFPTDDGVRYVAPPRLPEHQTVFAMTIHKSQGSEVRHAALVLPDRVSPLLTRELVYTAITRAKERVTVLGPLGVLDKALDESVTRASGLGDAVWGDSSAQRIAQ